MLNGIARLTDARSRRASSYDRSGGNEDRIQLAAGDTATLAQIEGPGCIQHIWITISSRDPLVRRNLVLRAYWDGQDHPSVESPIGDFFGQGWGEKYEFVSAPLASAPKEGNSLVSYWPMPFGSGARIEVENQGPEEVDALYFYIDYEQREVDEDEGRFHAQYRQELTAPESSDGDIENEWAVLGEAAKNPDDADNYVFCEPVGRGHYVGVNYYVGCPTPLWYGEGDDMFRIDGELTHFGTGTEDYFNMAWCPDTLYSHPYFGCARAPGRGNDESRFGWLGRTHVYRFHLMDPIRFHRSLRASIEHGHANALTLELASVAYWYQSLPGARFGPLASVEERRPRAIPNVVDVHRWRHAWRRERGGGALWGDEGE